MHPRVRAWLPLLGPLVLLVVWYAVVAMKVVNPILLPGPGVTLQHLWTVSVGGTMAQDFGATLSRTAQAFAIAACAAVLVVMFNSAYGVMNAKPTRIMAAQVMGATP